MPSVPLFLHRLADAIQTLEALPGDLVDRHTLQEALGTSKWTAWRILRTSGATDGPGGALVCRRPDLIAALRKIQADRRFAPEIARRERVAGYLDSIARYAVSKHKEIARDEGASELLSSRFASLPPGVDLSQGELRIAFFGTEDFLQKVGAVVYALRNDFEEIQRFIEQEHN